MKKILLLLVLFPFVSFSQVSIGLTSGVLLPFKNNGDNALYPAASVQSSLDVLIPLNKGIYLKTGVMFVSLQSKIHHTYVDQTGARRGISWEHYAARYVSIPLIARYDFGGKISPFFEAGVHPMLNVSRRAYADKNINGFSAYDHKPYNFLLCPTIGAGLNIKAGNRLFFSFMANINIPTSNTYKTTKLVNHTSAGVFLSASYKLK